jgi:2'-5' RNA ligase
MIMKADTARIFFALWPTDAERLALVDWQTSLHPLCGGRVMRPDSLHATLVFIGTIEVARLEALKLAAEEVSAARFELCFDVARYWGHNHILYAAPGDAPDKLLQLVRELERHLIAHHFKFEQRDYKPHITLLRNARWTDDPLPPMPPVCWQVKEFVLVQSGEVNYRVLAHFPLSEIAL